MLVTERSRTPSPSPAPPEDVQLRLRGGARSNELISLPSGTHSVGSAPHCSVRLAEPGVRPLHCLIVRDEKSLYVRRWSHDTLLNGAPFEQASLAAGDTLSIGPIELEVVGPFQASEADAFEAAAESQADDVADEPNEPLSERPIVNTDLDEDDEPPRENQGFVSSRRRRFLEELEHNRQEHDELAQRLAELERTVQAALVDRSGRQQLETDTDADAEEPWSAGAEFAAQESQPVVNERIAEASGSSPMVPQPIRKSVLWGVVDLPAFATASGRTSGSDELEAELAQARAELEEGKLQLAAALATIDALERQLAYNQREHQAYADERAGRHQLLAELESRVAEYAARIQELESQLARHHNSHVEQHAMPVKPVESPWPGTTAAVADPTDDRFGEPKAERGDFRGESAEFPWDETPARQVSHGGYDWSSRPSSEGASATASEDRAASEPSDCSNAWATSAMHNEPWGAPATDADDLDHEEPGSGWNTGLAVADDQDLDPFAAAPYGDDQASGATETGKQSSPHESEEVDEALAHLRELSIWRNVSGGGGETEDAASAGPSTGGTKFPPELAQVVPPPAQQLPQDQDAAADVEPSRPSGPSADSFIERYAHMFEDDASPARPASTQPPLVTPGGRSSVGSVAVEPAPAATDDEESIEQYMAKMMERLRGSSPGGVHVPGSQAMVPEAAAEQAAALPTAAVVDAAASGVTGVSTAESEEAESEDSSAPAMAEPRWKPAPQVVTNMEALRALANQTARHAIGVHTKKTLRRDATTRFIIALLAGMTSLFFALDASGWDSLQFATSCVALLASIHWARLTFASLVKAVRMGAFDKVEGDFLAVDSSHPALPIDVKR